MTRKPKPQTRPAATTTATRSSATRTTPGASRGPQKTNVSAAAAAEKVQVDAALAKKNAELEQRIDDLETSVIEIEKERDFYFTKLRNVELMLQVQQDNSFEGCDLEGVVGKIFQILYATAEEDVAVNDDGEVSFFFFRLQSKIFFNILMEIGTICR